MLCPFVRDTRTLSVNPRQRIKFACKPPFWLWQWMNIGDTGGKDHFLIKWYHGTSFVPSNRIRRSWIELIILLLKERTKYCFGPRRFSPYTWALSLVTLTSRDNNKFQPPSGNAITPSDQYPLPLCRITQLMYIIIMSS